MMTRGKNVVATFLDHSIGAEDLKDIAILRLYSGVLSQPHQFRTLGKIFQLRTAFDTPVDMSSNTLKIPWSQRIAKEVDYIVV